MSNFNHRNIIPCVIPYVIGTGLIIGGIVSIPKKEQCEITNTYHVHQFNKNIENTTINKWLQRENNTSFTKKDDYLPTTAFDLEAFDKLADHNLFDGKDNIDFIHYQITHNKDYLKFYYYYEETHYEKDEDGNEVAKTEEYEGWTRNPNHRGITGKTRIYHTRYYAYKLIYRDNKLETERSHEVDDVREILDEYPYINESSAHEIYETLYFSKYEVPFLELEKISPFYTPTVENNPLEVEKAPQFMKKK